MNQNPARQWPENFFDFEPITDVPDFKALSKELREPAEDPLADLEK